MIKMAMKSWLCEISVVFGVALFLPVESQATTVFSKPVGEYTADSAFVARVLVTGFRLVEISGFPHRVIEFQVREVFKGYGDVGERGSFTIPGGPKVGTNKVFAISGGMTSFSTNEEYIVFLKDRPVLVGDEAALVDSTPNVLVGWTALQVVYENGHHALRHAGNMGELRSAQSLSAQRLSLRHRDSRQTEDYDQLVGEITRAAAE